MNLKTFVLVTAAALPLASTSHAADSNSAPKNVVLVHGGFVDGSGWQKVYNLLKKDGYNVTIRWAADSSLPIRWRPESGVQMRDQRQNFGRDAPIIGISNKERCGLCFRTDLYHSQLS